jgi:DNA-binding PadR family transcriptional regulator
MRRQRIELQVDGSVRLVWLDDAEVDALEQLTGSQLWTRPGEMEGRPKHISPSLSKLAAKGLLERQDRWRGMESRATWEYRMNAKGEVALAAAKAQGWHPIRGFGNSPAKA